MGKWRVFALRAASSLIWGGGGGGDGGLLFHFILSKIVALLSVLKEVKRSADRKMIKLLTFDNLFPSLRYSRQIRGRLTTAITFSRQNDAGSSAGVIFLVLESKGFYNKAMSVGLVVRS